jgi:hypothetical protein
VAVSLQASPEESEILFDERRLPNPYRGELPRDEARHVLVVQAPGYKSQARVVRLDRDLSASVELLPIARKDPQAAAAASDYAPLVAPTTLPSAAPPREPPAAGLNTARARERARAERQGSYRDLPPPRPERARVPQLDKDDPWSP